MNFYIIFVKSLRARNRRLDFGDDPDINCMDPVRIHAVYFTLALQNKKCGRRVRPTRYAPPASIDTGTALGQAPLTFDFGGHGACG